MTKNVLTNKILATLIPLILGGLIYLTYRVETLKMFRWFEDVGAKDFVIFLRTNEVLQSISLPQWIKFSLPDALWIFSFTYFMLTIWKFKITMSSVFWIFLAPTIGLFSEVGQLIGLIPGTFDLLDLILIIVAIVIPFSQIVIIKLKTVNYEKIRKS